MSACPPKRAVATWGVGLARISSQELTLTEINRLNGTPHGTSFIVPLAPLETNEMTMAMHHLSACLVSPSD